MFQNQRTMESVSINGGLLALVASLGQSRSGKKVVRAGLVFQPVAHSSPAVLIFGGKSDQKKAREMLVEVRRFVVAHKNPTPNNKANVELLHGELATYHAGKQVALKDIQFIMANCWQVVAIG